MIQLVLFVLLVWLVVMVVMLLLFSVSVALCYLLQKNNQFILPLPILTLKLFLYIWRISFLPFFQLDFEII